MSSPRRPDLRNLIEVPRYLGQRPHQVRPITGQSPAGEPVIHRLADPWTLIMFLSTTCDGCQELWHDFAEPEHSVLPSDLARLVVTRAGEEPSAILSRAKEAAVVLSDEAWPDYGVHSGPFFVLVEGGRRVATEGVAWSLEQIASAIDAARTR